MAAVEVEREAGEAGFGDRGKDDRLGGMYLRGHPGARASGLVEMAKGAVRALAGSSQLRWRPKLWES